MFRSVLRVLDGKLQTQCRNIVNRKYFTLHSGPPLHAAASFHTSSSNLLVWEPSKKHGYEQEPKVKTTAVQHLKDGFKELKTEIQLWKNEIVERIESDPVVTFLKGETDIAWHFNNENIINSWITTADSDHNEGFSKCTFEVSKAGRGLFSGTLNRKVPKDGVIKKAGYCAIRSQRAMKSFKRDSFIDWSSYNTLVLKVRGDGRSYLINLSTEGPFDITWNDIYHYVLFTRGGPYWQVSKIPFSKFFRGAKGKAQDKQSAIPLDGITHVGVTCSDKIDGPFSLEIEYIGLENDPHHTEQFAYEMYKTEPFIVGSTLVE